MNPDDNQDENALAWAAVSLLGNEPVGDKPQWHEISAWRAGTLPELRSREVLSHIANDPEYFQQWLDLAEAQQWLEEEQTHSTLSHATDTAAMNETAADPAMHTPPGSEESADDPKRDHEARPDGDKYSTATPISQPRKPRSSIIERFRGWLADSFQQPMPVYGGALAAVVLAVLIAPLLRHSTPDMQPLLDDGYQLYLQQAGALPGEPLLARNTRSLTGLLDTMSDTEVEQALFQYGLRLSAEALGSDTVANWQAWTRELPDDMPDCSLAQHPDICSSKRDSVTALGQWSLLAHAACQPTARASLDEDSFWQAQYSLHDQFLQDSVLTESEIFGEMLQKLNPASSNTLCQQAQVLLSAGY